ncbi:polysaccharide deacetylase family protein [Labedaea rhizosphaerae]|uniref:Polysaccharide deacetylase n=1 Tax=Labedaea rhizosphaerae TaxID=598644 RepID=A0A4R6S6Q4_LABRH|nr:polysaccharide deacetylase family protein [Labedaea rhizosphaerae]TDP94877.1 polysaccharide deacetylase [Labedaea rhizosphaerae]
MIHRSARFRYRGFAASAAFVAALAALVVPQVVPGNTPVAAGSAWVPLPPAPTVRPAARPKPKVVPAKTVFDVETKDRVVFLTIDDGAVRDPSMITVLKQAHIRPTMFLTKQYVDADAVFFGRLRDETGGAIENHTATHPNLKGMPLAAQRAEIGPVSDFYARKFGKRPTLFRAPYGNVDKNTLAAAAAAGAKYDVHWDCEINDGHIAYAGSHHFWPGSIVLMHFRHSFHRDVAAFLAQARHDHLRPALLTDYLR